MTSASNPLPPQTATPPRTHQRARAAACDPAQPNYQARATACDAAQPNHHTRAATAISTRAPLLAALAWLLSLFAASITHAQPASEAQVQEARARGRDAMVLMQQKDYAGAEKLLSAALALHPAPTLYLMRGEARQQQNKLLAATTDYQAAARFPEAQGEHPKYAQARRDALSQLAQLPALIPSLTLRARGKLVRATVNGVAWPVDALPLSRSLDPGAYTIVSVDGDGHSQTHQVTLAQRAHETLELAGTLQPLAAPQKLPDARSTRTPHTSNTARYAIGATTLALTAAAIVTGIVALNKRADYHDKNRADVAMDEKERLRSAASTWGWVSTGLTGAAVAGAATFAYLTFVPASDTGSAAIHLTVTGSF